MPSKILVFIVLALSFGMSGCVIANKTFNIDEVLGLKPKAQYIFDHDGSIESTTHMKAWLGPLSSYTSQWSLKSLHEAFESAPIGYQNLSLDGGIGRVTTSDLQESIRSRTTIIVHHRIFSGAEINIWRALTAEQIRPGHWVPVLNPEIPEIEHLRSNHEYRLRHGLE